MGSRDLTLLFAGLLCGLFVRTATAEVACPSTDLKTFLAAFTQSQAVQRAFVRLPLQKQVTADADPEPQMQWRKLDYDQISFPVIPDDATREAQGLSLRIKDEAGKKATVILEKANTDYLVDYRFVFDMCWRLEAVLDYSL